MNRSGRDLLPIGSFSRATLLSVKALRLYDQLGILKPAHTDPDSGYRYYRPGQLREARLIRAMRQVGVPIATIRQVLAAEPEDAERLLSDYLHDLEGRLARARRRIPALISELHKEDSAMRLEVEVRAVDPQPIVSVTHRTTVDGLDDLIRASLHRLYELVEGRGVSAVGPPFGIYHGPLAQDEDGPIEVCVPVGRELIPEGEMESRTLSGGRLACVTLEGEECEFPAVLNGYDAVYDWIEHNSYEPLDAPLEFWLSGPADRQRKMEVCWRFRAPADT